MWGGELFNTLFEKIIFFVLDALKVTFHFKAQLDIFCKSLFKISAVSAGSDPDTNRDVSSAKIKISLTISVVISFIYNKNNKGPSLDPCGTPAFTSKISDFWPSTTTTCFLFVKYEKIIS